MANPGSVMKNAITARQRRSRCARCGASAALYITRRRLTTAAAATVTAIGESIATSWQTTSCAMPEKEKIDSAIPSTGVMPAAIAATPAARPKGTSPRSSGATSRQPARNSRRRVESRVTAKAPVYRLLPSRSWSRDEPGNDEEARVAAPRREHVEPGEPLHRLDRCRSHREGQG